MNEKTLISNVLTETTQDTPATIHKEKNHYAAY